MVISGFDWNAGNVAKCQKHGVGLAEIEELFTGAPLIAPDVKHSHAEDRFLAIGRTQQGRPLFVVHPSRAFHSASERPIHACRGGPPL